MEDPQTPPVPPVGDDKPKPEGEEEKKEDGDTTPQTPPVPPVGDDKPKPEGDGDTTPQTPEEGDKPTQPTE